MEILTIPCKHEHSQIGAYAKAGKVDPTHTTTLRNAFVREIKSRYLTFARALKNAVDERDCFGLKATHILSMADVTLPGELAFAFPRSSQKVAAFMNWVEQQNKIFLESKGVWAEGIELITAPQLGIGVEDVWTNKYVYSAYQKGLFRGRQELKRAGYNVPSIAESGGIGIAMNQPMHIDRLGLVYSRTYEELKGINSTMSSQISRVLSQGMAEGRNPKELARLLASTVMGPVGGLGITDTLGRFIPAARRAEIMARTEIIRAHHMATIQEYKNWGLEGVQVQAEWATAGDDRVCDECASLEGKIFTLEEIESMIPRHPQCRCIALPIEQKDVDAKKAEQEDKQNEDLSITLADGNSMEIPIEFRPPQECYENARLEYWAQKAKGNDVKYKLGLIYSQGDPYPIQHAWVETKDGKIIDSTLFLKTGHIDGLTISAIENAQVAYLYEGPMKRVTYYVGKTVDESNLLVSLRQGTRQVTKPMVGDNFWQLLYQDKKWLQIQKEIKTLGLPSELLSEKQLLAIQYKMGQGAPSFGSSDIHTQENLGGGVNKTQKVIFRDGSAGVFKPVDGENDMLKGWVGGDLYKREIATYELDKMIGFNIVPETVLWKDASGKIGSLQKWVDNAVVAAEASFEVQEYATNTVEYYKMRILDAIIHNTDRHQGNWMVAGKSANTVKVIPIDHGVTFMSELNKGTDIARTQMTAIDYFTKLPNQVQKEIIDKFNSVSSDEMKNMLTKLLEDDIAAEATVERFEAIRSYLQK